MDDIPMAIAFGLGIGVAVGFTGVGGGALILPVLVVVFGLEMVAAVATSFVFSFMSRSGALISHARFGNVRWRLGAIMGLSGVPTVVAMGALLAEHKQDANLQLGLKIAFLAVLAFSLVSMLRARPSAEPDDESAATEPDEPTEPMPEPPIEAREAIAAMGAGVVFGVVIGATSVGGGILVIPVLVQFFGADIRRAVGTSLLVTLFIALSGAFALAGEVRWELALLLVAAALPGTVIGARCSQRSSERFAHAVVVALMLIGGVAVAVKAFA
jgi:uncharacterized protein